MRVLRVRIVLASATALTALLGSIPTSAEVGDPGTDRPQACAATKSITLYAVQRRNGKVAYGRTPKRAKIPGPTLKMVEGECLAVKLINHSDRRVSMHAHGVDYTVASDGTPMNKGCVRPNRSRTYVFGAHAPSQEPGGRVTPGSAGYWHYHDHCMGGQHGTDGIDAGLFGALIVRREGDPVPDRKPFVVVMKGFSINLKYAPNTPVFKANQGELVEFVVIGHGDLFHTFHLHGHRWADTRTGTLESLQDSSRVVDNETVGPADSFGFQVVAGEHVGPGAWMYHCHVQNHADLGMSGIFLVRTPDGQVTAEADQTLRAWRQMPRHERHRDM
jgi:FtsP/CotA-like multicopper oxidase with cupredoxin domain